MIEVVYQENEIMSAADAVAQRFAESQGRPAPDWVAPGWFRLGGDDEAVSYHVGIHYIPPATKAVWAVLKMEGRGDG